MRTAMKSASGLEKFMWKCEGLVFILSQNHERRFTWKSLEMKVQKVKQGRKQMKLKKRP